MLIRLAIYGVAVTAAVWLCVAWWSARRERQVMDTVDRAWAAVAAGRYRAAADEAQVAADLRPADPRTWWVLGVALAGRSRLEQAEGAGSTAVATASAAQSAIESACELGASDRPLLADILASLLRVPAVELTLHACERVLAAGPDADALRFRALARLAAAQAAGTPPSASGTAAMTDDCTAALAEAVAREDGAAAARVGLSAAQCEVAAVVADAATRVCALDPGDPVGPFLKGWGADRGGDLSAADTHLSDAIDLLGVRERAVAMPSTALLDQWRALALECYGRRGRIRLGAGKYQEAALDLSAALKIEPRWAEANHLAARAFLHVEHVDASAAALRRAAQYGSSQRRTRIRDEVLQGDWDALPEDVRGPLAAGMVPRTGPAGPPGPAGK